MLMVVKSSRTITNPEDLVFISKKTANAVGVYMIKKLSLARYVVESYQNGTTFGYVVRLENRCGDLMGYASGNDYMDMKSNPLINLRDTTKLLRMPA